MPRKSSLRRENAMEERWGSFWVVMKDTRDLDVS